MIFADTSFLLSLAGNDSNSAAATAQVQTLSEPVRITALNRLEFENAIRLLQFRRVLPEAEASATLGALAGDEPYAFLLESIEGREADYVVTADGRLISGISLTESIFGAAYGLAPNVSIRAG